MTGWLREFVPKYAIIADPLQARKTTLLTKAPYSGSQRQDYARKTHLKNPTPEEKASFEAIQEALSKPRFLYHFDHNLILFVDLDASLSGFGAIVYQILGELRGPFPTRSQIRPTLFLSRKLKSAETRYWSTELELAGSVWVLKKILHLAETAPGTIVYTDHRASLGIVKQIGLTSSSTEKLNLRLVRASAYVQTFRNIEFRHKPGASHKVPDALSRLTNKSHQSDDSEGILDALWAHAYTATSLVEMSPEFKARMVKGY